MQYKTINQKFDSLLLNIQKYFEESDITLFKQRNIVKVTQFDNKEYVIKSFKIPHLLNQVVYNFFRASKAKRSYENSLKLIELGINTPQPIGYIEFNNLLFFKNSYYVSELFKYDYEIRAIFKDKNFQERDVILKEFVKFSLKLHNKGVYHVDYSPGNILVASKNKEYIFYIIDVNRMKFVEFDIDLRAKSMSKLTDDKEDIEKIIAYYSEMANFDKDYFRTKFNFYIDEQRKYLDNKQKLKKLKF